MLDETHERSFDPELDGPFPSAWEDERRARLSADSAQTRAPAYRLGFADNDLLLRDELRSVRLQLEFLKPELLQQDRGIRATIAFFGSARIPAPGEEPLRELVPPLTPEVEARSEAPAAASPLDEATAGRITESLRAKSRYYTEARHLAHLISSAFGRPADDSLSSEADGEAREDLPACPVGTPRRAQPPCGLTPGIWTDSHCQPVKPHAVVITGGGPGIMEAANRGAHEANTDSIGLNIVLPFEQAPNQYITPELCFNFHYFAIRKMHFLMRAVALVVFPGGFGTLDELFDVLTLIQTHKIRPIPVLMFGRSFWKRIVDFDALVEEGMISPRDVELFTYVETAEEAWAQLEPLLRRVVGPPAQPEGPAPGSPIR
jgi:hypothetical protein